MENEFRSKNRVDLLFIHIDLDVVDADTCKPPMGLEFEAFITDPAFRDVQCFHLKGIKDAGIFFQGTCENKVFCFHQEAIRLLYRIENFFLKRNYFISDSKSEKTLSAETLAEEQIVFQPTVKDLGRSLNRADINSAPRASETDYRNTMKTSAFAWGDEEDESDEDDILSLDTEARNLLSVRTRKQSIKPRFLDENFLDGLTTMGQRQVLAYEYVKSHKELRTRDYYLFDFVALFVDFKNVFEDRSDFKTTFIQDRLELLFSLEGTDLGLIPIQSVYNKGWNSSVKFLCQTLNGEYQLSFLRVALLYSIRRVAKKDKIQAKMSKFLSDYLLVSDKFTRDCTRIVRLNFHALANNRKLLLDKDYAENCLSPVFRE